MQLDRSRSDIELVCGWAYSKVIIGIVKTIEGEKEKEERGMI